MPALAAAPGSAGARPGQGRSSSGLTALRGLHLDKACAPAVIWQLTEARKTRSNQIRSVHASRGTPKDTAAAVNVAVVSAVRMTTENATRWAITCLMAGGGLRNSLLLRAHTPNSPCSHGQKESHRGQNLKRLYCDTGVTISGTWAGLPSTARRGGYGMTAKISGRSGPSGVAVIQARSARCCR
jgi:hypothetical protein